MRVFVLSLADSRVRRLSALRKIAAAGLAFEIVDGVDARKMKPETLALDENAAKWMNLGEVGCYLGHLRILQRIVDYGLSYACILEDDFCFEKDPLFCLAEIETRLPPVFHYIHLQRDLGFNSNYRVISTEGAFWRVCETPLCTNGYLIERSLAQYILQHHANCEMPIDHLYAKLSHRGRFYQTIQPLIGVQLGLESDIHAPQSDVQPLK